jgi:hypothetical protein
LAVTPHIILQFGISDGTEAAITNVGRTILNPSPGSQNPLYPSTRIYKDPGAQIPTFTACVRFDWNDGKDNLQPCMNGINSGVWGYNNLQWYGFTFYHKFDDHWHISAEFMTSTKTVSPTSNIRRSRRDWRTERSPRRSPS